MQEIDNLVEWGREVCGWGVRGVGKVVVGFNGIEGDGYVRGNKGGLVLKCRGKGCANGWWYAVDHVVCAGGVVMCGLIYGLVGKIGGCGGVRRGSGVEMSISEWEGDLMGLQVLGGG